MSSPQPEAPAAPTPAGPEHRSPLVAAAMSLVIPGLGHVHLRSYPIAIGLLAFDVLSSPAVLLAWYSTEFPIKALVLTLKLLRIVPRVVAAGWAAYLAVQLRRAPPKEMPQAIVFATFVFASFLSTSVVMRVVQGVVPPPVHLTAAGGGLQAGEVVQCTRRGDAAAPREGTPAVFQVDWPTDAPPPRGLDQPPRQGFVGWVTRVEGSTFFVEGREAGIPVKDYVGRAIGVLASKDGARVGTPPSR